MCRGVWMGKGSTSSRRCMRISCPFIRRSGDNCKSSFFIRTSQYSVKKNSLACAGVVVLVNRSDGSVVEDSETGGSGNMCLGAVCGEENADWERAVSDSLLCMSSHVRMQACVTSDID